MAPSTEQMKKTFNESERPGPHNFISIAKDALLKPDDIFNEVKKENGIKKLHLSI